MTVSAFRATAEQKRVSPVSWPARLLLLAAIWGMSFLFIKVADESLAPLQVALGRMIFGTAALLTILGMRRELLPRGWRVWLHLAVAALLLNALPFSLFAYGETTTSSVLAGICNATTPLFTLAVAAVILRSEPPSRAKLAGLVVGFGGVLIVLGVWEVSGGGSLRGALLCLGAAISYGFGFPYARLHLTSRAPSALALATGQVICGTVELGLITPWLTHAPTNLPPKVVASVFVLGAFGTGIAYILNYSLIRDTGPTMASTVTYLVPFFSTAAGLLILGDAMTWNEPVGGMVLILGVAISQGRLRWGRSLRWERSR